MVVQPVTIDQSRLRSFWPAESRAACSVALQHEEGTGSCAVQHRLSEHFHLELMLKVAAGSLHNKPGSNPSAFHMADCHNRVAPLCQEGCLCTATTSVFCVLTSQPECKFMPK